MSKSIINSYLNKHINPIALAKSLKEELDKGLTQVKLAEKLNTTQANIANKLRLLSLPDYVISAIEEDKLSERHGRALLKVKDTDLEKVFEHITSKNYTIKETEDYIKKLYSSEKKAGVAQNVIIGVNTIEQAVDMCKKAGLDVNSFKTEYENEIKITVKIRK